MRRKVAQNAIVGMFGVKIRAVCAEIAKKVGKQTSGQTTIVRGRRKESENV